MERVPFAETLNLGFDFGRPTPRLLEAVFRILGVGQGLFARKVEDPLSSRVCPSSPS